MAWTTKLLGNSISLLTNRVTQSVTSFVLVAFIARILGAYQLGQYTLAFSYYFVFMTITAGGFKTLFTREISRHPQETPLYLVNGTLLQLVFSLIGYLAMVVLVFALPYNSETSTVCYILGLMIVPFSLSNITEAIFQAYERMYLITISTVPIYILRLFLMIWVMNLKHGVNWLVAIMVISETLIVLIEWGFILQFVTPQWQINSDFIRRTVKAAWIFLFIEGMNVIKDRMQILILSLLGGEVVVGMYGAVVQLMQPFQLIAYSLVVAVFPRMSKTVDLGREKQRQLSENVVEMLLIVSLPLVVGVLFLGQDLLILIYSNPNFTQATTALNILAVGLVASSYTRPLSYALVANGFEKLNLITVIITSILGILLSIILVNKYQLNGAAISSLLIQIIAGFAYIYHVYKNLFHLQILITIRRPIIITMLMLSLFVILERFSLNILLKMLTATSFYIVIVAYIAIQSSGGFRVVCEKFLFKKRS
ncbi:flippase [Anabaena lutea]|uniref:Flippase n=1 Tax=Anabaena lutea FACHB-196 TaxID=2692881 RepID=A0ABR8FDY2_9NOST|nr:flippase [Anabaena lutea]MBD2567397.1 flippase [Anabaena lutea FACHB-196]